MFQFLVWFWAGLLIGVSFIATPAKFLAPSISLQQALDVGRSTFFVFKWVEVGLIMLLLVMVLTLSLPGISRWLSVALIFIVAAQYLVLLPVLDARVALILQGELVQESNLHRLYVAVELLKVGILAGAGYSVFRVS